MKLLINLKIINQIINKNYEIVNLFCLIDLVWKYVNLFKFRRLILIQRI